MSRIRLAQPGDLAVVEEIVHDAYAHYVPLIGRKPAPMIDDYRRRIEEQRVHVLEEADAIAGLIVLIRDGNALTLYNVAVRPQSQKRGFGRELIAFAEEKAREDGCNAVQLFTNALMTRNIALYMRLGYVETHRAEGEGHSRVFMTKRL
jgi:ribosomal protein S18 acetylase RimI-like enzyme